MEQVSDVMEQTWTGPAAEIGRLLLVLLQIAIIIAVAVLIGRFAKRHVARTLTRPAIDSNIPVLASNLAVVGIYILAFSGILVVVGGSWSGVLAVVGAGTIVIGLSLQDLLRSYVAGVYLLLERPFGVGDRIRVRDVDGNVESVELRTTILRTNRGEQITIPNSTVFSEIVTNRSTNRDEQTTVTLSNVDLPVADLTRALTMTLAGLSIPGARPPKIELISSTAEGTTASVTLYHPPGTDRTAALLTRLRERFPAADLAVDRG